MMRRKLRREVVGFCVLNCPVVVVVVGPVSFSDGGGSEMVRWSFGWVIFNIHIYLGHFLVFYNVHLRGGSEYFLCFPGVWFQFLCNTSRRQKE